ncbi:glycine-rich selenoprotein-like [Chironomus tepperi]|uniref:glycine-rich selenoprotein-like n=1 Tax=Chironomus tepperi TaxID=113505 RepID=UPI00391F2B70
MPYVASDGRILDKPPITKRIELFFVGIWTFLVYFFKTLFGENVNKSGSRYTRDYRSGGGGFGGGGGGNGPSNTGPRPPQRRIGRIGRMSDVSCPPMGGG